MTRVAETDRTDLSALPGADPPAWHAMDAGEALARIGASEAGLTGSEAEHRLRLHGPNRLPEAKAEGALVRLLRQFNNPLILFLVAAALLSLALGHPTDAIVIAGVVLANTGIGFFQEGRAAEALSAIRAMIDPEAVVLRDGRRRTIPAAEVVPGDLILLDAGDRIPADLRLVDASQLRIDEAILTGESVPVRKSTEAVPGDAVLGDRVAMAFAGTFVVAGQGRGVAVATGAASELGRISAMLGRVEDATTPLMEQMGRFARRLTVAILLLSAAAFSFAMLVRGQDLAEAFMLVVGISVAAIPEGLPAILTVTLAVGVQRMAGRNALIRRLPAVETLGSVTIICSDKTGTLTRNEMAVTMLVTPSGSRRVDGVGYAPQGRVEGIDEEARLLATAGLLCNDAEIRKREGDWAVDGDPMEGALVALAHRAGVAELRAAAPRIEVLPFSPETRLMATTNRMPGDDMRVWIKGAPEAVLPLCGGVYGQGSMDEGAWHAAADRLAGQGLRVLAFATHDGGDLAALSGARFLGLAGLIDPPRAEAIEAVAACRGAGIRVAMITGDHAGTALAIARQLGLADAPGMLTGADIDALDDAALGSRLMDTAVFARTAPEHKLRLVEAFQRLGHVVAMTGDGVNDAPALKRADIGIAMGKKGTEAAKDVSDMVLADDNFASIAAAVREGRTVWDNLMKVISWALPVNGGEALAILSALLLGVMLPITPLQILWVNMVTASALGIPLAFEPPEPGSMRRPPRERTRAILSGRLLWRILFVSLLFVAGAFGMFLDAQSRGASIEEARTLAVNTIVVMEIFYLFSIRYVHGTSITLKGILGTPAVLIGLVAVIVAQLLFTYWPPLQALFDTRAVAIEDGLRVIAVGVVLLLVVELEKLVWGRMARAREATA
jgi:calcium-translocating P-type ATPase